MFQCTITNIEKNIKGNFLDSRTNEYEETLKMSYNKRLLEKKVVHQF